MKGPERKRWLFEQIALLRRAERALSPNRDIAAVRAALERELGGGVSPALAAAVLGVSRTTIARWIASGDIPAVEEGGGRVVLPLRSVLELHDAVVEVREGAAPRQHVLEPALKAARRRAAEIEPSALVAVTAGAGRGSGDPHARAARRSLAYHRALAPRLDRAMADDALRTVWAWRSDGRIHPAWADRWEQLLVGPLDQIRAVITADTPDAADLRQSSPLVLHLSGPERRRIIEGVR